MPNRFFSRIQNDHAALLAAEMRLVPLIGQARRQSLADILAMSGNRAILFFLILTVAALVAFDTNSYQSVMSVWWTIPLWTLAVLFITVIYLVQFILWCWLNHRRGAQIIYMPVIGLIGTVAMLVFNEAQISLYSGREFALANALRLVPYNFVLVEIFDVLYLAFVLPVAQVHGQRKTAGLIPQLPSVVTLAGKTFQAEEILYASSSDHYLNLHLKAGRTMVLARIGDLVEQMAEIDGVQPHRSWWVSRAAVVELRRDGAKDFLILSDGVEVPVARGRTAELRVWHENPAP